MKTFLDYVAEDIIRKYGYDLSHMAVVFPNKRASLFLSDSLARTARRPLWSPAYLTISEMFRRHSSLEVGDRIKLICDLHKSFIRCTGIDETLDHFYGWGELLLADFDDIDKNMADAGHVFSNLKNMHRLDDISYLTSEQKATLQKFFSNFSEDQDTILKQRFMQLWSNIGNIYDDYRERLRKQNIAYEGMLYREVASDDTIEYKYDTYLFVGFNVVQKVERKIFDRLQEQDKARFYWDFDKYYMPSGGKDAVNEAGHYISGYLKYYPNELDSTSTDIYDNMSKRKNIVYINSGTDSIQARYISSWLRENGRTGAGQRTAVVLCNENMLQTVVHCLPEEAGNVNVTAGFPLSQSPLSSLVSRLLSLYLNGYNAGRRQFKRRYVMPVITHPYSRFISTRCKELKDMLYADRGHSLAADELSLDNGLSLVFGIEKNGGIVRWLTDIMAEIARNAKDGDAFFQESVFCIHTLLVRISGLISSGDLIADNITLQRLILQLISTTSIPFHGEPVVNTQIMGVLETRNLDFDHILVLSCNEGHMPKSLGDSSFIPYSIRKAYGLTTIDNKVAIYSYYFHRMLQRANDITLVYNSSTDDGQTGEMSRFMMQLMVESGYAIERRTLHTEKDRNIMTPRCIEKTPEVMDRLMSIGYLSPTAMNNYRRCPLRFYYNNVAKIKEPDNIDEDIDNRIFGNIFHLASELIYRQIMQPDGLVKSTDIERVLKDRKLIETTVDTAFRQEFFKTSDSTLRAVEYNGLQLINREVIIRYIRRLLEIDKTLAPFTIICLEGDVFEDVTFDTGDTRHTVKIGGRIDRLDRITDSETGQQRIRVIDYKTGGSGITRKPCNVEEVFDPSLLREKHTDYYFQAMLYSTLVRNNVHYNRNGLGVSPALLFIQHTRKDGYDPTLLLGKEKITDIKEYDDEFRFNLIALIKDIYNNEHDFEPTADRSNCDICPYRQLCGN
ncbi:PD-(D/E)XK nuclease family protein [Xylanibacter caecicola]|uniref:PD-(D/E)XK nuclease family protein n=1 Tax=Xylanibacter caecicola TaxID=2736294 RepID=UPI00258EF2A8|nr:PD-(D/E)XK nuclease family protein [Xylanibacter caecicola]